MEPQPHDQPPSVSLSQARRADRVCDRFEAAWKEGTRPRIDDFLTEIPRAEWHDLLRELLIVDLHYCRKRGESPTLADYVAQYPALELDRFADLFAETSQPVPASPAEATAQFTPTAVPPPDGPLPCIRLGDYELLEEIARGGMGVIYKARQISLNRIVAVKMILAGRLATKADHDRFHCEAQAAALLDHPNIVPVFEVGEYEGQHYFSMGYVAGQSLAARLAAGPLPPKEGAELVATVAEAVEYAHRQGVIHRDIKPSNILLDHKGRPRVSDFGLAKRVDGGSDLTATGQVLGTPSYMAPEQAAGQIDAAGPAADVYSLGALLYATLTGRPPFQAATPLETMRQVREREPVSLRQINAAVPRDLETIVLKSLDKHPQRRYLSAQGLADDLRRWLEGRPIVARRSSLRERAVKWARRRPAVAAMSGTMLLVALTAFAVITRLWLAAESSRRETERLAIGLSFDKGRTLCEQGDVSRGLLWMAHTLEMAPPQDAGLQHALRENLAAWSAEVCPLQGLVTHPAPVKAAVFNRDGTSVLTVGGEGRLQFRDVSSGDLRWEFDANSKGILAVALSRDGRYVATGGEDGTAQVWEASKGKPVGSPLKHGGRVLALEFAPDGKRLLTSCDDNRLRLWEVPGGKLLGQAVLDAPAKAVAFSPDGGRILAGGAARASVWDAATLRPIVDAATLRPVVVEHTRVLAVSFSPDGDRLLTGSGDRTARQWDARTGRPLLDGPLQHQDFVHAVAFSPDGKRLLTAGSDQTVRLWDSDSGRPLAPPLEVQGPVWAVAFRSDGGFAAATREEVRCWGTAAHPQQLNRFEARAGVTSLALSEDGRILAAGTKRGTVHLWDVDARRELANWAGHGDEVWAAAFCAEGGLVTGSRDGAVKAWDANAGHRLRWELNEGYPVRTIARSPDGFRLLIGGGASSAQGASRLRDHAGQPIGDPPEQDGAVWAAAWAAAPNLDGKKGIYATSSGYNRVRLWDLESGQCYDLPPLHHGRVTALVFHPDGRILLTGSTDRTARLWNTATREPLGEPMEHAGAVNAVAFAAHGSIVVTGDAEGNVRFWDAATGTSIGPPMRHRGTVWATQSPTDGRCVFSAGEDKTVRQWDIPVPLEGEPRRITRWVQVLTGMELDGRQARAWLDAAAWRARRQKVSEGRP